MAAELSLRPTSIPGLVVLTLPVHGDDRGFFKENWQRAKMVALGLPDLEPVQNNVSFNASVGVTRGFHAEPWNKLVSVATGKVFGAWVDLREGETFGRVETIEIDEGTTVFVPAGVANAFQTLEPGTAYSYLVDDHWSPAARDAYTYVNLADPALGVRWPVPLDQAELSAADRSHPLLADVTPMRGGRVVIVGSGGQVGQAFAAAFPHAERTTRAELDLADPTSVAAFDWTGVRLILNAAAYTQVDLAETPDGRRDAWAANATGVGVLARIARERHAVLVHVSSDYVFDGTADEHTEDEPLSPLGVYGQTKAAGDLAALEAGRVYVLRSSWVVGAGGNFVRTMASLADRGVRPSVVCDQLGRLTFADEIARAAEHLVATDAPFGVYHLSGAGPVQSWADIAGDVFALRGVDRSAITPVSTEVYAAGKQMAPRPQHSALSLAKIEATGFAPRPVADSLRDYLAVLPS